jgi:NADH-quinone oxidoreductase subunit E
MVRRIARYIQARMTYELSGGWNVAPTVLERGTGSCSEYTFLMIAMCRAAGVPARYVGSIVVRGDDASQRGREARSVRPGDDLEASSVERRVVEGRPDLEDRVAVEALLALRRERAGFRPVELSAAGMAELERLFPQYPTREAAVIPALWIAQREFGWISAEVINLVSGLCGVAPSHVYGVVSFYAQFYTQPRGRHTIRCCRGTACHVKGSLRVLETLTKLLKLKPGQTSRDRLFSIEVVACMGACGLAPVVNMNGEFHAKVTPKRLAQIVTECREKESAHVQA